MDDTVAANLLAIYQSELNGTYIAFTGSGVAGDASSFLNANTNYARIDGPSVWIEFICQNGIVFRNQIHYHTLWRDHLRDYGKDLSLTTALDASASGSVTVTSIASNCLIISCSCSIRHQEGGPNNSRKIGFRASAHT